jgi:chromosome segregation ATPase
LKTCENDLDFYRKQSQAYESDIAHLKQVLDSNKQQLDGENLSSSSAFSSSVSMAQSENLNLMLGTNKRLKEEIDSVNNDNTKLKNEITTLEEEISNLKSKLCESEMKTESFKGK